MSDKGLRYNAGKPRWDLVPMDAVEELVEVYTYGASKYAPRNWEQGLSWMDCYASLMRHLSDWSRGLDYDGMPGQPDETHSGRLTMAHVAWNALALLAFQLRGAGKDDRPVTPQPLRGGSPIEGLSLDGSFIQDLRLPLRGPNYEEVLTETVNAFLDGEMGEVSSDPTEILAAFADALLEQLETDRDLDQVARAIGRDDDPMLQIDDEELEEVESALDFATALEQEAAQEPQEEPKAPEAPEAPEEAEKPASEPPSEPGKAPDEDPKEAGSRGKEAW